MYLVRWLLVAAAANCVSNAEAGEITLKRNFLGGWQYSIYGAPYEKVGMSGSDLKAIMQGNDQAVHEIDIYKSRRTWAAVTGWPSGFALGWTLGATLAGSEWRDGYTVMLAAGVPLCVVSLLFEDSATNHLRKAVAIHNGEPPQGVHLAFYERSREQGSNFAPVKLTLQF